MLANPKIRMGVVGFLIVVVGYLFVLPKLQSSEEEPLEPPEFPNPGPTYTLGTKVYNLLTTPAQQQRYLKLGVVFEFTAESVEFLLLEGEPLALELELFAEELGPKRPIIQDAVGAIVSSRTLGDVSSSGGRQTLKDELLAAVTAIVGEPELLNVYFTEFVFQ